MTDPAPIPRNGSDPFSAGADALRVNGSETPANGGPAPAKAPNGHNVIDLRDGPPTRVRVSRDNNPFSHLSKQERMRLIVRVLCEIVAYGELDDTQTPADTTAQPGHPAVNG